MAVPGFECSRLGFAAKVSELIGRDFRTFDPHNKSEAHQGPSLCTSTGLSSELAQGRFAAIACAKARALISQMRALYLSSLGASTSRKLGYAGHCTVTGVTCFRIVGGQKQTLSPC